MERTRAQQIGPFELVETIGTGTTAVVWRGQRVGTGEPVAIKVMSLPPEERQLSGRAAQFRRLFAREVRAMAALDHPGIVRVLDHGQLGYDDQVPHVAPGAPYIVMDWIPGGDLDDRLDQMQWNEVRAVLLALLDALAHAHARGVIHRDLKPGNVLMGPRGPVLTDFGIMHRSEQDRRHTGPVAAGTPGYMAPEQTHHDYRRFGPWTDLYAIGCLTYEMVTGRIPYRSHRGTTRPGLVPPRESDHRRPFTPRFPVPAGLEAWVAQLLEPQPQRRTRFAADAARGLMALGPAIATELADPRWGRPAVLDRITGPLGLGMVPEGDSGPRDAPGAPADRRIDQPPSGSTTDLSSVDLIDDDETLRLDTPFEIDIDNVALGGMPSADEPGGSIEALAGDSVEMNLPDSAQEEAYRAFVEPSRWRNVISEVDIDLPESDPTAKHSLHGPNGLFEFQEEATRSRADIGRARQTGGLPITRSGAPPGERTDTGPLIALQEAAVTARRVRARDPEDSLDQSAIRTASTWIDPTALGQIGQSTIVDPEQPPVPGAWQRARESTRPPAPDLGRALTSLREPDVQGRQRERAVLWRTLCEAAEDEQPRAIVLEGAPGVGKTRLARWLGQRAHELGLAETLVATHAPGSEVTHGLTGMLTRFTRSEGIESSRLFAHLRRVLDAPSALAAVSAAFIRPERSLRVGDRTITLWTEDEAFRVLLAILQHLASRRRLVICIDDAQWGDEAVRFVADVLRRGARLPAVFVLTVRADLSVEPDVREALDRVLGHKMTRRLRLDRLERAALGAMLDACIALTPATRDLVLDRAAGHPQLATELVKHWALTGDLEPTDDGHRLRGDPRDRFADLDAFWDARIEALLVDDAESAGALLEIAAAMGIGFDYREWYRAARRARLDPSLATGLYDRLMDAGLLHQLEGGRWQFAHESVRAAFIRRAHAARRLRQWHTQIARMLLDHDPDAARLVHHLTLAGHYGQALPRLIEQVRASFAREDLEALRRLVLRGARLHHLLKLSLRASASGVVLRACWAWVAVQQGLPAGTRHARRAFTDARRLGVRPAEALALASMGHALRTEGDPVRAATYLRRGVTAARRAQAPQMISRISRQLSAALASSARFAEAETVLDAIERLPDLERDRREVGLRRLQRATLALSRGDADAAHACAEEARAIFSQHGMRADVMAIEDVLGQIARVRGHWHAADAHHRIAYEIAVELGDADAALYAVHRGQVLLAAGRYGEANASLQTSLDNAAGRNHRLAVQLARLGLLACAADAGRWARFDALWYELASVRQGRIVHRDVASIMRTTARLAEAAGQHSRAAQARRLAVDQLTRLGDVDAVHGVLSEGPVA